MSLKSFIQGGTPLKAPNVDEDRSPRLALERHKAELAVQLNAELLGFAYRVLDGAITGPKAWAEYRTFEQQVKAGQN